MNCCGKEMKKINFGWTENGEFEKYRCEVCGSTKIKELGFSRYEKEKDNKEE